MYHFLDHPRNVGQLLELSLGLQYRCELLLIGSDEDILLKETLRTVALENVLCVT